MGLSPVQPANRRYHLVMRMMFGIAFARRRRFLGRGRPIGGTPAGRSLATLFTALMRSGVAGLRAATRARFLAAAIVLVHRRPGAALGFVLAHALFLVAFLDMLGLALLLVGIGGFIALGHFCLLSCKTRRHSAGGTKARLPFRRPGGKPEKPARSSYHRVRLTRAILRGGNGRNEFRLRPRRSQSALR